MRALSLCRLVFLIAATGLVACASEGDGAEDQDQDITGGAAKVESSAIYLFDTASAAAPKCAGALLSETIGVTAKVCAQAGMVVGRASDAAGKGVRAQVKAVHAPDAADADVVVIELDKPIGGGRALITHAPLRDGYTINAVATTDGRGLFSPLAPNKGEPASVNGQLVSETEMDSALIPSKGSTICAGDIGAPVCSSTATKIAGFEVFGTCGLSGLVVAAPELPVAGNGAAPSALDANGCSAGAWKVAQLGRYAEFLKRFAPKAFEPLVIDRIVLRNFPHVPDGLWGYKSAGTVKTCKIETPKIDSVPANTEAKLSAKVVFAGMQENAAAWGRFGIASKSAPTKMRWLPASTTAKPAKDFEATFEGAVRAELDGEYVVAFRASANGGETWTECDLDGSENGFSADKALPLRVGADKVIDPGTPKPGTPTPGTPTPGTPTPGTPTPGTPTPGTPTPGTPTPGATPAPGTPAAPTKPQDAPASPNTGSAFSDPPATPSSPGSSSEVGEEEGSDGEPAEETPATKVVPKKKKKASASGCSAAPRTIPASSLPTIGLALGLAALVRRRRR